MPTPGAEVVSETELLSRIRLVHARKESLLHGSGRLRRRDLFFFLHNRQREAGMLCLGASWGSWPARP